MNATLLRDILDLLERAKADLEKDWPEAAYDAIGRAIRLAREAQEAPPHG
jgi:hypothetical protein